MIERERAMHIDLQRSTARRINALRSEMGREIADVIRRESVSKETYDTEAHARVRRALQPIFERYYGRARGDEDALFFRAILASTREAYITAFRESLRKVRRHVSRRAYERIEGEANELRTRREVPVRW